MAADARSDDQLLHGRLGFVEDHVFAEASLQHRCDRHPHGIVERLRAPV
jgi:hypothetical protein